GAPRTGVGKAATPITVPKIMIPKIAKAEQQQAARSNEPAITPETYLRSALCLLEDDAAMLKRAMKKPPAEKTARAELALAIVEGDALAGQVRSEIDHRGLSRSDDPTCGTRALKEMVEVLRSLVGPVPKVGESAEHFGHGLERLRKELET